MTIKLRDYQQTLADEVRQAYRDGFKCPLVVLPTGGGKTVLFSYITHGAYQKSKGVMLVAHRKELISQISQSLARFGVSHDVIAPDKVVREIKIAHFKAFGRSFVNPASKTVVGSVQTVVRRFDRISHDPDLIILDEAHHVVSDTQWGKVLDRYQNSRGLCVTATPERLDGRGLGIGQGGYADTLIEGPSMAWLIENGFLSPYRCFTTQNPIDLTGIRTRMGDYAKDELAERVDKPFLLGDAVSHYKQAAAGMRAVAYCVSVEHSKHTAAAFSAAGIPSEHFDGDTDDDNRSRIVRDFADGKIVVLSNVGILTEGFDLASIAQKDVTIDCVIDLAPTKSMSLYLQKVGRCLRPAPGKVAVILDHAGNVITHGLPDMEREWSLDGVKKRKRAANDNEPDVFIQTCTQCYTIHRPAPVCPTCGHVYPVRDRQLEQRDGELVELTKEQMTAMQRQKRIEQGRAQSLSELMAQGISRPRAEKILQARADKDELVRKCLDAGAPHGLMVLRRMKPKELKSVLADLESIMAA